MSSRKSCASLGSSLVAGILLAAAAPEVPAQFVPIRELDSNGVVQNDYPTRMQGGFVAGSGWSGSNQLALYWDAGGTHLLPLLPGLDISAAHSVDALSFVGICHNAHPPLYRTAASVAG